jgi:hypothetical protein
VQKQLRALPQKERADVVLKLLELGEDGFAVANNGKTWEHAVCGSPRVGGNAARVAGARAGARVTNGIGITYRRKSSRAVASAP